MKTTMMTMTMDNSLNMNNISNMLTSAAAYGQARALRLPEMAYVPGSWLEAKAAAGSQKAIRKARPATPVTRSIWLTLPEEHLGEKVLLGLLVAGAVFGICYGFAIGLDLIQSLPALHSLAIQ